MALQNGFVSRDAVVAAFGAWTGAKHRSLADILSEQDALSADASPEGDCVITVSGKTARIWNARTSALLAEPLQHAAARRYCAIRRVQSAG